MQMKEIDILFCMTMEMDRVRIEELFYHSEFPQKELSYIISESENEDILKSSRFRIFLKNEGSFTSFLKCFQQGVIPFLEYDKFWEEYFNFGRTIEFFNNPTELFQKMVFYKSNPRIANLFLTVGLDHFKEIDEKIATETKTAEGLIQSGQYKKAAQLCNKLLKLDDQNASAYNLLGVLLCLNQDYKTALTYIEKAFSLNQEDQNIRKNMIELYQYFGKNTDKLQSLTLKAEQKQNNENILKAIGSFIQEITTAEQTLFVMGALPQIYDYAKRKGVYPQSVFDYTIDQPTFLKQLSFILKEIIPLNPPEIIVMVSINTKQLTKTFDLTQFTRVNYSFVKDFSFEENKNKLCGINDKRNCEYAVYRLDKNLYYRNLCEYTRISQSNLYHTKLIKFKNRYQTSSFKDCDKLMEEIEGLKNTLQTGQTDAFLQHLHSHDTWSEDWEINMVTGEFYFHLQDIVKALEMFKEAYTKNPLSAELNNNLGVVYYILNDFELAGKYLSEAISLCPEYNEAKNNSKLLTKVGQ